MLINKLFLIRLIAAEISRVSRYYDQLIHWQPMEHDDGSLLGAVESPNKRRLEADEDLPDAKPESSFRNLILLNGNLNHHLDIQALLEGLKKKMSRTSRLCVIAYNPYLRWVYTLANYLGLRRGSMPTTFMTRTELESLAKLSGFEVVRMRPVGYWPNALFGLGRLINKVLPSIPFFRHLSLVSVVWLRPVIKTEKRPSLSIVIPARNEAGNIENALLRMPNLGTDDIEFIFVEGHSKDNTWEEIQRVAEKYVERFKIKYFQQTGVGKSDAVRLGFAHATGELITILDADLTMPPELLGRFYDAYCEGLADFINGNRLLYPMEGEAMRFLNRLGNIFFAKSLSFVLDSTLGDSLCGTKLLLKQDYERMIRWRSDFGDFDPFGDYELLFPASSLALGVVDIPIHYRARTYGSTNIHRFRHGLMLLKMMLIGLLHLKMGDTNVAASKSIQP